jgi:glutamyl-tRNA synthetase
MSASTTSTVRTRFAPSPTGFFHVGAFRTALFSWLFAKKHGGQFVLRIEDTDQNRLVPGSLEHIVRSFRALGIDFDEGPDKRSVAALSEKYGSCDLALLPDDGGRFGPYFQSQRLERYKEVVNELLDAGKAYHAFETREELEQKRKVADALKRPFLYDRKFRDYPFEEARKRVESGEAHVVRLKMPTSGPIVTRDVLHGEQSWDATTQDDFVILKADGFPPYHLAAMVDDHDMEISHVLRGDEWLSSFPKHWVVFEALGWEPPLFAHVPNVLGNDGKKLSKRHGALPLLSAPEIGKDGLPTGERLPGFLDDEGFLPEAMTNFLALIGWSPGTDQEIFSEAELIEAFSLDGVGKSGGNFDKVKLEWMNGKYLRSLTPKEYSERAWPFLVKAGADLSDKALVEALLPLEQEKIKKLSEVPATIDYLLSDSPEYSEKSVQTWLQEPDAKEYVAAVAAALNGLDDWSVAAIESAVRTVGEAHGRDKGEITHPIRVAVTGREIGPSLFETLFVLGKERLSRRFGKALELAHG